MKYKVKAGKEIRVREGAMVTAKAVGTLASHVEFDADVYAEPNPSDTWVRITSGQYAGRFGAVKYSGQVFAEVGQPEPTPEPNPTPTPSPSTDDVAVIVDTKLKTVTIHSDEPNMGVYFNGVKLR